MFGTHISLESNQTEARQGQICLWYTVKSRVLITSLNKDVLAPPPSNGLWSLSIFPQKCAPSSSTIIRASVGAPNFPVSLYWPKNSGPSCFQKQYLSGPSFSTTPVSKSLVRRHVNTIPLRQYASVSHHAHKAALQLLLRVPKRGAHRGHKMIITGHMNGLLHFIVILMCDIRPMLQNCDFMDIISHNEAKAGSVAVSRLYWHRKKECFHCFLHVTSPGKLSWQLMRMTKWHCSNCL